MKLDVVQLCETQKAIWWVWWVQPTPKYGGYPLIRFWQFRIWQPESSFLICWTARSMERSFFSFLKSHISAPGAQNSPIFGLSEILGTPRYWVRLWANGGNDGPFQIFSRSLYMLAIVSVSFAAKILTVTVILVRMEFSKMTEIWKNIF